MFAFCALLIEIAGAIDPKCQAAIEANSQSIDRIRTIQVEYTISLIGGQDRSPSEVQWSRDGKRERIRVVGHHLPPTADGRPRDISDVLLDGQTYSWLQNWSPNHPQPITPMSQGTVLASVGPQTHSNAGTLAPSYQLLLEVDHLPRRTLRELAQVSPNVKCTGKVEVDGRDLWLISLESPEETTAGNTKRFFDVYLDPNASYMIRKLMVKAPKVIHGDGTTGMDEHQHEVVDFKDFGDGIFVPMKIRNGTLEQWRSELVVRSVKVNEPIAPEAFKMNWPKFALIRHLSPAERKVTLEVWGDGKPLRDSIDSAGLPALEAELRKDPQFAADFAAELGVRPAQSASMMVKLSIGLGVLVAIMIGLVLYRRIREQAAA